MYKKYTKIISLFMSLVMIMCYVPISVNAADMSIQSTTAELPTSEGVYYLKNVGIAKYMQIDDGEAPQYSASGGFMELWGLDKGNYQQWKIIHIADGYYKIQSVISGLVLSVQSGSLNTGEANLVQESYSGATRQQWKFEKTDSGSYIIRPRSGESYTTDWCMAAGDGVLLSNGRNVEQRKYTDDSDYKDEWVLEPINDKAIVIVPGILGSSLETTSGTDVWLNIINYGKMELTEAGSSVNSIVSVNYDNYGANNTYKTLYESLKEAYGSVFDIIFFDYDFRLSINAAATKLASETSFYDEVVLVAHSMGGLVASKYLANSSTNRSKTSALISLGTPYAGAAKCIDVMETGDMISVSLLGIDVSLFKNTVKNMSKNCYSAYQLLPTSNYYNLTGVYPLTVSGVSYSDAIAQLKNAAWGKNSSGSVKPMFSGAVSFHSSLTSSGTYVIDRSDVTVYTLAATGQNTISTVNVNSAYEIDSITYSNNGDGTVLKSSAGYGTPNYSYTGTTHTGMVSASTVIARVKTIISSETGVTAASVNNLSLASTAETDNMVPSGDEGVTEYAVDALTVNELGWIENFDNRRINIYADSDSVLLVDGMEATENNDVVYDANGVEIGNVWQVGDSGRKMYVLYDGEYQVAGAETVKIEYMNEGYCDMVVEFDSIDSEEMSLMVSDYKTQNVDAVNKATAEIMEVQPSYIFNGEKDDTK